MRLLSKQPRSVLSSLVSLVMKTNAPPVQTCFTLTLRVGSRRAYSVAAMAQVHGVLFLPVIKWMDNAIAKVTFKAPRVTHARRDFMTTRMTTFSDARVSDMVPQVSRDHFYHKSPRWEFIMGHFSSWFVCAISSCSIIGCYKTQLFGVENDVYLSFPKTFAPLICKQWTFFILNFISWW